MVLVAIFSETGFFDYCAVKVSRCLKHLETWRMMVQPLFTYSNLQTLIHQNNNVAGGSLSFKVSRVHQEQLWPEAFFIVTLKTQTLSCLVGKKSRNWELQASFKKKTFALHLHSVSLLPRPPFHKHFPNTREIELLDLENVSSGWFSISSRNCISGDAADATFSLFWCETMRPSSSKSNLLPTDQVPALQQRALILKKVFCPSRTVRLSWLQNTDVQPSSWILSEPPNKRQILQIQMFFFFWTMMWTSQSICWCTEAWRHWRGCSRLVEIPLWLTSLCPVQPCRPTSCPEEESGPWSSSSASSPPSSPPSWTTSPPWCSSRPLPSGAEQLCVQTISGFLQLLFIKIQPVQSRSGVFSFFDVVLVHVSGQWTS